MVTRKKNLSQCPDSYCTGSDPPQRPASDEERAENGIPGPEDAWTCTICGCVYTIGTNGQKRIWDVGAPP
jgi:hypothetical protein